MKIPLILLSVILIAMGVSSCDLDVPFSWKSKTDNLSAQAIAEIERGKTDRAEIAARMAAERREVFQQNLMLFLLFGGVMFGIVILYRLEKSDQKQREESSRREAAQLREKLFEAERLLSAQPPMTRIRKRDGREYYLPAHENASVLLKGGGDQ